MEYTQIKKFNTDTDCAVAEANKWMQENHIVADRVLVMNNALLVVYTEFEPLDIDENYDLTLDDLLEDGDLF